MLAGGGLMLAGEGARCWQERGLDVGRRGGSMLAGEVNREGRTCTCCPCLYVGMWDQSNGTMR